MTGIIARVLYCSERNIRRFVAMAKKNGQIDT
jgi:MarR-like DNA-binding transcriptional regulator SgrR of sgrS sRNA